MKRKIFFFAAVLTAAVLAFGTTPARALDPQVLSRGQTVYVPAYPSIYIDERGRTFQLTTTLILRNTDPVLPISVTSVKYYNDDGVLIKEYLSAPVSLGPLAVRRVLAGGVEKKSGTHGKSFVVQWESGGQPVNQPMMETLMVGVESMQGISFMRTGQVIEERGR